jgi:hypothetical protein
MSKYIVSALIQSRDKSNPAAHVQWYKGDSLARAITALSQAAVHDTEVEEDTSLPASVRYQTLGVTLSIEHEVPVDKTGQRMIAEVQSMGDLMPEEGWCQTHDGRHTFTNGEDMDDPCIGWRTEQDMVRGSATDSTVKCEVCGAQHIVGEDCPNYGSGEQHSATGSTVTFDTESESLSLSDCYFWQTESGNWPRWASGECAGPRIGLVQNVSDIWDDFVMCEHHFNQMPRG